MNEHKLPVMLVHGLAGSRNVWMLQLEHLRARRPFLAIELRGHGSSPAPRDGDYSIASLAADIEAAAAQAEYRRFALVGHSMGAWAAIEFARRYPERVAGLLLVDPSGDYRGVPEREKLMTSIRDPQLRKQFWEPMLSHSKSTTRELVLRDLDTTPRQTFEKLAAELFSYDPVSPLSRYEGPKLAVLSPSAEEPEALHRRIPTLPQHRFEDVSHWIMLDAPIQFNVLMDDFMAGLRE